MKYPETVFFQEIMCLVTKQFLKTILSERLNLEKKLVLKF